jgi:hypothetical protein
VSSDARVGVRSRAVEYLTRVPDAVPPGVLLVHNDVWPVARRGGTRGSRFWLDEPRAWYKECDCGWAAELGVHHRVVRSGPRRSS